MSMLSEDDVNLADLSAEELDAAWDLWFDLAQSTSDSDPPYSHGVFVSAVTSASKSQNSQRPTHLVTGTGHSGLLLGSARSGGRGTRAG
jgi:hypothetical protein